MNSLVGHFANKLSVYILVVALGMLMGYYYFVFIPQNEQHISQHADRLLENKAKTVLEKYSAYSNAIATSPLSYFLKWAFVMNPDTAIWIYQKTPNDTIRFSFNQRRLQDSLKLKQKRKDRNNTTITAFTKKELSHAAIDVNLSPEKHGSQIDDVSHLIWQVGSGNNYFIYRLDGNIYYNLDEHKTQQPYLWVFVQQFMANLRDNDFFDDLFLLSINDEKQISIVRPRGSVQDGVVLDHSKLGLVRFTIPDSIKKFGTGFFFKKIAGQSFGVYCKQLKLKRGLDVYLVGLVEREKLNREAREVPAWFVVFCSLAALLVVFLIPIIKIFSLNDKERLLAKDARHSVFSMILGISLLTIILCGNYIFWSLEKKNSDEELGRLSNRISESTRAQVDSLKRALKDDRLFGTGKSNEKSDYFKKKYKSLQKVNEVFSVNTKGNVIGVFNYEGGDFGIPKFPFNVESRGYFKMAKAANENKPQSDYSLESINSFTTGHSEVGVSLFHEKLIRVITSRMPSVISPVIPSPYRFVVTNKSGDIKFHSNWKELQIENFLSECNDDVDVKAHMDNAVKGFINFNYLGNDCRGYGMPLVKDWYLIVYYESANARNLAAEVFGLCLLTLALVVICTGLIHYCLLQDRNADSLLKTHDFIYHWLNPFSASSAIWMKLSVFCVAVFLAEILECWFFYSVVSSLFFVFLCITLFYLICYSTLTSWRTKKGKLSKTIRGLMILFLIWIICFVTITIKAEQTWQFLFLFLFLSSLYFLVTRSECWFSKLAGSMTVYGAYRCFIASCLMVIAIGPSIIFISGHYYFASLTVHYHYAVDDSKKLQTSSVKDIPRFHGYDYTDSISKMGNENKVNENIDSTLYAYVQSFQPQTQSLSGLRLDHLPNTMEYHLIHDHNRIQVASPASVLSDSKKLLTRVRPFQKLKLIDESSTVFVILISFCVGYGLWRLLAILPRKIFFAPDRIVWDCYPAPVQDNFLQHEFENDDQPRHPLYKFDVQEKKDLLNDPQIKDFDEYLDTDQRLIHDQYILKLQELAKKNYHAVWVDCTTEEKYFMYDLALDGIANQANQELIGKLAEKGLLRLRPHLKPVNVSFANYIMHAMTEKDLLEWKTKESAEGNWANMKWILIILLVTIFVFLSVAEENFLGRVTAMIASVGLVIPQLVNIVSSFGSIFKKA